MVKDEGDCDFLSTYSAMLLGANIMLMFVSSISGWLADLTERYQHRIFQVP